MTDFRIGCRDSNLEEPDFIGEMDFLESSVAVLWPPKSVTGLKIRKNMPKHVGFVISAPRYLMERVPVEEKFNLPGDRAGYGDLMDTDETRRLYKRFISFADSVKADAVLFETPPDISPGDKGQRILGDFFRRTDRHGMLFVWAPRGFWTIEESSALALEHDVLLAVDPILDKPPRGDSAYLRLGPFSSMKQSLNIIELEKIAAMGLSFGKVFVSFGTQQPVVDARNLRRLITGP